MFMADTSGLAVCLILSLFSIAPYEGTVSPNESSARVSRLVGASLSKKGIHDSGLFAQCPLMPQDVAEAVNYTIEHADSSSYHLLIAIRRFYPATYQRLSNDVKGSVLSSALKNSFFLNDWGSLSRGGAYDGESAKALLEVGMPSIKWLTPILNDSNQAPLYGSKESTMSEVYGYRRKDFAFRYVLLILKHTPPVFSADVKERDGEIEKLKTKLESKVK